MILANYAQQNRNTVREFGMGFTNPLAQFKPAHFKAFYTPGTAQAGRDLSGFNHGYNTHYSWSLPLKTGGIASTLNIRGTGSVSANALAVKLAEAALTGSGELTAVGGLIVQLIAAITGSGTVTTANLQAFLAAVANLTGSGGITDADLEGFGALLAALQGAGTAASSTLTGTGELTADLVVTGTGLSTANVGQAVWSALAALNNAAGTMGALLNGGSAGGLTTDQATQLLEIFQRLGLDVDKPLSQTATEISTDDWTLTVTEGVGTVTVERQ